MCASTLMSDSKENCEKYFINRKSHINKENSFLPEQYIVSCRFCKVNFKKIEDCQEHFCNLVNDKKGEKLHSCYLCSQAFTKNNYLDEHLKRHFKNNCNYCRAQFTRRKELCKHLKIKHNISEPEKFHICSFCEKKYFQKISLIKHLKVHSNGKSTCSHCGLMFDQTEGYLEHIKQHDKNLKFQCQICSKRFTRGQQYNQHIKAHEKHACVSCNVSFSTEKMLKNHEKAMHSAKMTKKHQCQICDKRFNRPALLIVHQRVHSGEKPLKCFDCNKYYYSSESLAKHYKSIMHLNKISLKTKDEIKIEKKYKCDKCNAEFFRLQSLQRHIETLHSTGVLLKCEHCNYSSKFKANFKRHLELHSQTKRFTCQMCNQAFRTLVTLKDHLIFVHSDKRNFPCDLCDKRFKSKSDLARHKKIHSDNRPYKCSCIQSFKRISHLKRHLENSGHQINFIEKYDWTKNSRNENNNVNANPCVTPTILSNEVESDCCDDNLSTVDTISRNKSLISAFSNQKDEIRVNNFPEIAEKNIYSFENVSLYSTIPIMLDESALAFDDSMTINPKTKHKQSSTEQSILTLRNEISSEILTVPELKKVLDTPMFEQAMMLLTSEPSSDSATSSVLEPTNTIIQSPLTKVLEVNENNEALKLIFSVNEPPVTLTSSFDKDNSNLYASVSDQTNISFSVTDILSQSLNLSKIYTPFSVTHTAEKSLNNNDKFTSESIVPKYNVDTATCAFVTLLPPTDTSTSIPKNADVKDRSETLNSSIVELQPKNNDSFSVTNILNTTNNGPMAISSTEQTSNTSTPDISMFSGLPNSMSNLFSQSQLSDLDGDLTTMSNEALVPVTTSTSHNSSFDSVLSISDQTGLNTQLTQENTDSIFDNPYCNNLLFSPDYSDFISPISNMFIHTDVNLNSTVSDVAVTSASNLSAIFSTKNLELSNEQMRNCSVENSNINDLFYSFL